MNCLCAHAPAKRRALHHPQPCLPLDAAAAQCPPDPTHVLWAMRQLCCWWLACRQRSGRLKCSRGACWKAQATGLTAIQRTPPPHLRSEAPSTLLAGRAAVAAILRVVSAQSAPCQLHEVLQPVWTSSRRCVADRVELSQQPASRLTALQPHLRRPGCLCRRRRSGTAWTHQQSRAPQWCSR